MIAARPWNTSTLVWAAVDDRVRGGSSQSYLEPLNHNGKQSAKFYGVLDTTTLGGAGFASRSTRAVSGTHSSDETTWDLSSYDGLSLAINSADDKTYTLTLKDELPRDKRSDGRERSGISWEAVFNVPATEGDQEGMSVKQSNETAGIIVEIPWASFKATYRGRDVPDAKPLETKTVRAFSLLMRSFFEKQDGEFELIVDYIAASRFAE